MAAMAHAQGDESIVSNEVGMVASNHPLASMAGMEVLLDGGNAVDAAIATAAALGVVEPYSSGLGGDGFMLVDPAQGEGPHVLNFSGRTPRAIDVDDFEEGLPTRGPSSATIPGAAAGWARAHERFGNVSRDVILAPAIEYAEEGYLLSSYGANAQSWASAQFLDWDMIGARTWWGEEAIQPPGPDDRISNERLADTYRTLAENGFRTFLEGPLAEQVVEAVREYGGSFTMEDMRSYEATWHEPLSVTYREHRIHTPPPNSSGGLAMAQILKVLETLEPETLRSDEAHFLHYLVESVKLAAADRQEWVGDPEFSATDIPLERLTSDAYARERSAAIDPERAATEVQAGEEQPGTSHISIVDEAGTMVSMTMSLGHGWGSGFVAGGTGVVLNNGVQMFDSDPESPAFLEGGKRGRWNMAPVLVTKEDRPFLAIGTPGGTAIWQVVPQVLVRLIDHGASLEEAVAAPRVSWRLSGTAVTLESTFEEEVLTELENRGHTLQPLGQFSLSMGGIAAVMIDAESGRLIGASDPRREGYALGW